MTAQNSTVVVNSFPQTSHNQEVSVQVQPWDRQIYEPAALFMLFTSYRLLGRKRSLQALVTPTQVVEEAPKSTKQQKKSKSDTVFALSAVKPSVPGNIKEACKKWRWVARAQAWDMKQLQREEARLELAMQYGDIEYARRSNRIMLLSAQIKGLQEYMQTKDIGFQTQAACIKLQSQLMKQIAEETSVYEFSHPQLSDMAMQK